MHSSVAAPTDSEKETDVTSEAASAETIGSVACSNPAVSADKGSDVVQTPVEADADVPSSPAVISSAAPADLGTESTDVSTRSAPVDGPHMPPSKIVQVVAGNRQPKRPAVSKTPPKSQKVRPGPVCTRRPITVEKGVQFETCLSSLSVRRLLLDIKNTVATIGRTCVKMQQKPVEKKAAAGVDSQATEVRYNTLLKTVNLTQLLLSCNGIIALQPHQDLLFCRVCQTDCEKAAYSPSCSDNQFGLFRHCLGKGYGDFSKPSSNFRALRRDIWTHLNGSRHIHRLETWFMQNQANGKKEYQTAFICAGDEIMERVGNNLSLHRNLVQISRPANKVADASSAASQYHVAKIATASKLAAPAVSKPAASAALQSAEVATSELTAPAASNPTALAASKTSALAASKHATPASKATTPDTSTPTALFISKPTTPAASQPFATTAGVSAMASTCSSQNFIPFRFALDNKQNTNVTVSSNQLAESTMGAEDKVVVFEAPDIGDEDVAGSNLGANGASIGLKVRDACPNVESSEDPASATTERKKGLGECESDRGFDTFEPVSECRTVSVEYGCSSDKAVAKSGDPVTEIKPDLPMTTKNAMRVYICRPRADGKLIRKECIPAVSRKVQSSVVTADLLTAVNTPNDSYSDVINAVATNTAGSTRSCVPETAEPSSGTVPLVRSPRQLSAGSSVSRQQTVASLDPGIQVKLEPENQDEGHRETGTFMVLDCSETDPPEYALSCERSTSTVSSHRSGVAGDQLEDFSQVVKEEPVVADTEARGEEEIIRPVAASTCTVRLAYMQSALFQHLLPAGHSQTPVIMSESNGVLSTPSDRNNTNGRRIVSDGNMKTQTPRVRRLSYVRVPTKASSSDGDGCRESPGTCGPSKRTGSDARTDHLSKRLKADRNT